MVALVCLSLAVITLDYRQGPEGPLAVAGGALHEALAPLQRAVTAVTRPIGDFFSGLANLPSLAEENRRLQGEVDDLRTQVVIAGELQADIDVLSDLLDLRQTLDPTAVPAVVIANGISNFDWTITIDKGAGDGVTIEQAVVTGSADAARLVGSVVSVTEHTAEVQLIIDRGSSVAGEINTTGEVGLVTGRGDQDLRMDYVTRKIDLTEVSQVLTVAYEVGGQHGRFPPHILIGEVSRVFEDDNQIQTSVSVRPAVDFTSLEFVLVLQTSLEDGSAA